MRIALPIVLALTALQCNMSHQEDPFSWLEEINGEAQLEWVRAENERSLSELQGDPRYNDLYEEALAIVTSSKRIPVGKIQGAAVFNFRQDKDHVRGIWQRSKLVDFRSGHPKWEIILDIDRLADEENENWIFQKAHCLAPDYDRCIVSLSRGGSDASVTREFSVTNKRFIQNGFSLPEGKNGTSWLDDNTLLVSSDWGEGRTKSGYPRTVKIWQRGTSFTDAKTVFEGNFEDVLVSSKVYRNAGITYPLVIRSLTFYKREIYWVKLDKNRQINLVPVPLPLRVDLVGVLDGRLIASLQEPWEVNSVLIPAGSLVALHLEKMTAEEIFRPAEHQALAEIAIAGSSIVTTILDNVTGVAMRFRRDSKGWHFHKIAMPADGVIRIASTSGLLDELFLLYESLNIPQQLFHVSSENTPSKIMALPEFFDTAEVVVKQNFATSRDGTKVPYFIMGSKTVLDRGNAPTIQYGYGGFLIPILPNYYQEPARPQNGALAGKLWVSRGGLLVLSNIRGGGEYGPRWHEAALKENRHLAYEDFVAISEDLIARNITSPEKLGAMGRSNGGLLMGVALTQRPDLYAAIDCGVPLLDMKRYTKLLAGASWISEFGDPDQPEDWAYISQYSPYQNLSPNQPYPEVFFYTSTKDDRVHPGHARKTAAKMAALGYPFYYYENIEGGHGGTANQKQLAMRTALEYIYFIRQLMEEPTTNH